jgi:hypothetical protein
VRVGDGFALFKDDQQDKRSKLLKM